MDGKLARLAGGASLISVFAFSPPDSRTQTVLADATWIESVIMTSSDGSASQQGVDDAVPEPLTESVTGEGYSLAGGVSFPLTGPPNTNVIVSVDHENGLTLIGAGVGCRINFQFQVVETAGPPVPVTLVPVHIHAQGTAEASGDTTLRAASYSQFTLIGESALLEFWGVSADNVAGGAPPSDSFANDAQLDLVLGEVVSGEMIADASIGSESPGSGTHAQAVATADPVIEVADQIIPGTSSSYRDYFDIEFSPGYYALGQSPVRDTTWGKIKRLYGN
jgi:hypothetical protein